MFQIYNSFMCLYLEVHQLIFAFFSDKIVNFLNTLHNFRKIWSILVVVSPDGFEDIEKISHVISIFLLFMPDSPQALWRRPEVWVRKSCISFTVLLIFEFFSEENRISNPSFWVLNKFFQVSKRVSDKRILIQSPIEGVGRITPCYYFVNQKTKTIDFRSHRAFFVIKFFRTEIFPRHVQRLLNWSKISREFIVHFPS